MVCHRVIGISPAGTETYGSEVEILMHFHCVIIHITIIIYILFYIYTGGAKKMYTHFKRRYLYITFQS